MSELTLRVDPKLRKQLLEGKAILRDLREALEDLEDRIELAQAKKRNRGKSGVSWQAVKKEFGWKF